MKDPKQKVPYAIDMLFPQPWLNAEAEGDPQHRTNREVQTEVCTRFLLTVIKFSAAELYSAEIFLEDRSHTNSIANGCHFADVCGPHA